MVEAKDLMNTKKEVADLFQIEHMLLEKAESLECDRRTELELMNSLPEGSPEHGFSEFLVTDFSRQIPT